MRFRLEQQFSAALPAVEAAFVDPALLAEMATLPGLGRPQLVGLDEDGDTVRQQVRYAFTGELSPAVTAAIDPQRLTWVEHSEHDRRTHRGLFHIVPDHYADRLSCSGSIRFEVDGGVTRRVVEGDLRVRFPFVAAKVERAIVAGLHDHAAAEAGVVQAWLDRV